MQIGPLVKTQQKITIPSRYHNFYTTSFHAKPTFTQHAVTLTQLCHSNITRSQANTISYTLLLHALTQPAVMLKHILHETQSR